MISSDGKYYKTDVADTEQLFRLIQSIPSKKSGNLIFQALIRGSAGMKNGINYYIHFQNLIYYNKGEAFEREASVTLFNKTIMGRMKFIFFEGMG